MISWDEARYSISIGGRRVDRVIAPYLIKLSVTDHEDATSDSASIDLSDFVPGSVPPRNAFLLPGKGTPVSISLGSRMKGVVPVFTGTVDSAKSRGDRGGGRVIVIECKGLDTKGAAKTPRRRHKDDVDLGAAAKDFATAGGLSEIRVHPSLAAIRRDYWAMDGESIIAWGKRTAREVGGLFKVVGTVGILVPKGAGLSASGKPLRMVRAVRGDNLISWDLAPDRGRAPHARVLARHYDVKASKWVETEVEVEGSGSAGRSAVRFPRAEGAEAKKAAEAEATDEKAEKGGGRVDIDGDPSAVAGAPCRVSGTHPQTDRTYKIKTATQHLERSRGFWTSLDVTMPDGS